MHADAGEAQTYNGLDPKPKNPTGSPYNSAGLGDKAGLDCLRQRKKRLTSWRRVAEWFLQAG